QDLRHRHPGERRGGEAHGPALHLAPYRSCRRRGHDRGARDLRAPGRDRDGGPTCRVPRLVAHRARCLRQGLLRAGAGRLQGRPGAAARRRAVPHPHRALSPIGPRRPARGLGRRVAFRPKVGHPVGMSTERIYSLPVEVTDWKFDGATEIHFNWEYDDGSSALLELYEKGKKQQWDASTRLDWALELNPDNPMELKDGAISIYDTDYWRKMSDQPTAWLRR